MKTQRTLDVDDIHCEGCSRTIRDALADVEDVRPDPQTKQVVVTLDDQQVDEQTIARALADAGFPVRRTLTGHGPEPAGDAELDSGQASWSQDALLTAGLVMVALAGYVGYELYPRFDLSALDGAGLLVQGPRSSGHRGLAAAR